MYFFVLFIKKYYIPVIKLTTLYRSSRTFDTSNSIPITITS